MSQQIRRIWLINMDKEDAMNLLKDQYGGRWYEGKHCCFGPPFDPNGKLTERQLSDYGVLGIYEEVDLNPQQPRLNFG